jgi:16S rRNA (cytidine1402-2'-O)-methyltransferase
MKDIFSNRTVAVVREITKLYEEVRRGTFEELIAFYEEKGAPKGEVVLVLSPPTTAAVNETDIDQLLRQALETHKIRDACTIVAGMLGIPRKQAYQRALQIVKRLPSPPDEIPKDC